jgi:hypothetical protein
MIENNLGALGCLSRDMCFASKFEGGCSIAMLTGISETTKYTTNYNA